MDDGGRLVILVEEALYLFREDDIQKPTFCYVLPLESVPRASAITMSVVPLAFRSAKTLEPMNPAPPVTMIMK